MIIKRGNIHFILVRTQFASNLGSTVRVMKNMGIDNLILVQPECEVGMEARSYAMKGADILDQALFYPTLEAVGEKLSLLIGTTARFKGKNPWLVSCRDLTQKVLPSFGAADVGIVFGSEDNGLRREELRLCQWLAEIPTGSEYPVINLAQSAAILAYELNLAFTDSLPATASRLASPEEVAVLVHHTTKVIEKLHLPVRMSVERLMKRMKKIVFQARLEKEDVNMLHGLLKEFERKESKSENPS